MIPYNINPGTHGVNGFGLQASDSVWRVVLDGSAEATVTVPSSLPLGQIGMIGNNNPIGNVAQGPTAHNKYIAVFEYGIKNTGDVWVSLNAAATAPSTAGFVQGAAELHPKAWNVKAGDIIHAISTTASVVMSVAFYHIVE